MGIAGVLFDKDGVLVDFQRTYAPATAEIVQRLSGGQMRLASQLALAVDFNMDEVSFSPRSVVIAGTAADIARAWHPFIPTIDLPVLIARIETLYDDLTMQHVTSFADVSATLKGLKRAGLFVGLATNDTEESAHRHLKALGVSDQFDFINGYDSGHGAKPEPGMIQAFAKAIGTTDSKVVMVGDSLHDMTAGRAAGAICVAVTTGLADRETLQPAADHVIDCLSQLTGLIDHLNAEPSPIPLE